MTAKKGFTLVEVLVSLSIFTMVVVTAVSVLLTMVSASAKARDIQSIMTNLSFALDSMTREIRTGSGYYCQSGGSSNNLPTVDKPVTGDPFRNCLATESNRHAFSFIEGGNSITSSCSSKRIGYRYNATDKSIERRLCNGSWYTMTSPDVVIEDMSFTVTGSSDADSKTPVVTIQLRGKVPGRHGETSELGLQTTVSQYLLDI